MSLFGSQQQPGGQQQSGGGLFGSPATQPQTGGLFGQTQQQQQQSGGLFGQTNQQQQPSGGGLFGQQQPQQQPSGGGLFGQQQPQQQPPGGGLFGQQQPQQQQGAGLFGQTNQPSGGGGLFGQTGQQQPQQSGGGLFGQTSQQPQQSGGGLFGQSTQPQQSGGLFGQQQPQQQPQQQQGGGMFGQQQNQQQMGGGMFGQSTQQPQQQTGGFFGGQNQQQSGGGLFGQQQPQQQQGGGLFGQSQFGGTNMLSATSMNQQQQTGSNAIADKVLRVKCSWDVNHTDYAFKYYFYNHIGKERAVAYQKPPGDDAEAWEKAWAERPNDACVPVRANGFKDLDLRVQSQQGQANQFRASLRTIQEKLNAIQNQHEMTTSIKLEDCRRRHIALARRALSLAAKVQVLKNRGYALQPEEEMLKKRLEGLARVVRDPANTGRMNEIWARMMVVQEKARIMDESMSKVEVAWDENQLQVTGKLLASNSEGLAYLTKEVLAIEKSLTEWQEANQGRNSFGGL